MIDHNTQPLMTQTNAYGHAIPSYRLARSGAYLLFDGSVRYADLSRRTLTYHSRAYFTSPLTINPLVILQEGVKAFDLYYGNDGLDATYEDTCALSDLILLDAQQLLVDFGLDQPNHGGFKGHIVELKDIKDVLSTFRPSSMKFDLDLAAQLRFINWPESDGDTVEMDKSLVLSLQQVHYNYISNQSGNMDVLWNLYAKLDSGKWLTRLLNK